MPLKKDMIDPNDRNQVMEAAAKYFAEDLQRGDIMENPKIVSQFLISHMRWEPHENFYAMFLDTRHRMICFEKLFSGTIDGASVYSRVVVKRALDVGAAAVVAAHNHPSGVAEPSCADRTITQRLKQALDLVDIRLLDHFVVGEEEPVSMSARGML